PGQNALDLDIQRETQEGPDQDDDSQDGHVLQRRLDSHGSNEVGGHEDLKAQQDAPAEVVAKDAIASRAVSCSAESQKGLADRQDEPDSEHNHADDLECLRDPIHGLSEMQSRPPSAAVYGSQ